MIAVVGIFLFILHPIIFKVAVISIIALTVFIILGVFAGAVAKEVTKINQKK